MVLDMSANTVVSRPLHKFWSDGQLRAVKLGVNKKNMGTLKVQEATEKLDGAMVYAVPVGHTFELWTRNGPTHHGNIATTWAVQQGTTTGILQVCLQSVSTRGLHQSLSG